MTKVKDLGPLQFNVSIVDKNGRPSPEFQRRWNTQRSNNNLIGAVTLGSGPPPATPAPDDGTEYVDISADPAVLYVGSGGTWIRIGVFKFIQLEDVPNTYTGGADDLVQVKHDETGLKFTPIDDILKIGFSFNVGGRPEADEQLGAGVWTVDIHFENGQPYEIVSLLPAAASAVFSLRHQVGFGWVDIGTITFGAGATTGTLAWTAPITIIAGNPVSLWGPSPQDATLSNITGMVTGVKG